MALELFKPFIFSKLQLRGEATTIKAAKRLVEREGAERRREVRVHLVNQLEIDALCLDVEAFVALSIELILVHRLQRIAVVKRELGTDFE